MIKPARSLNIIGTLLAKNEADIVAQTIEHNLSAGISKLIVTDNGSTDATRQIVEKYPEVIELIDEPGTDHHQSSWVTRMARLACKLNPDWIVHLDADELWGGFSFLKRCDTKAIGCTTMYLHPPAGQQFHLESHRHYLDFSQIAELPGECKIAHRPDPEVVVTHGNHGLEGSSEISFTRNIWRHHYPVRTYEQFQRKAIDGHLALMNRNAPCARWESWYNLHQLGKLREVYDSICSCWQHAILNGITTERLLELLKFWSTDEVAAYFKQSGNLPTVKEWPRSYA